MHGPGTSPTTRAASGLGHHVEHLKASEPEPLGSVGNGVSIALLLTKQTASQRGSCVCVYECSGIALRFLKSAS
jgi:hypothetical protein